MLVDRLWPRGLNKASAAVDLWLRDLAPSDALRKWFHAHTEAWPLFRKRYLKELAQPESAMALNELYGLVNRQKEAHLTFRFQERRTKQCRRFKRSFGGNAQTSDRQRPRRSARSS